MKHHSSIPIDIQDMPVPAETPRNDLLQLGLRPLEMKDGPVIDSILCLQNTILSAYSFAAHYIWRDIFHFYWGVIDDHFCLFAQYGDYLYMPLPPIHCHSSSNMSPVNPSHPVIASTRRVRSNPKTLPRAVFSIMNQFNKDKAVSRIENIDEVQIKAFISMGYDIRPGEGEYVYLREDLTDLKGDRYKSKRALCNYFVKHYSYSYEPFQPSLAGDCIELYNLWKEERGEKMKDPFYHALLEDSFSAHKQAMRHYQELHLTGRVVRVNGRVEGYIFGFERGDIFYILMEITNPEIKGLAQSIFREFCREREGYAYINALGDSGLENLKRVKQSYRPWKIIPSYIACEPY